MKNKLFLIVAFSIGMQSNISIASEPSTQSWGDWFRSKWTNVTKTQDVRPTLRTAALAGSMLTYGSSFLPEFSSYMTPEGITKSLITINLSPYLSTFTFLALAGALGRIINLVRIGATTKDNAI